MRPEGLGQLKKSTSSGLGEKEKGDLGNSSHSEVTVVCFQSRIKKNAILQMFASFRLSLTVRENNFSFSTGPHNHLELLLLTKRKS
jgi:hypothetical protein